MESCFFHVVDGISTNKIEEWIKYIPNSTSLYSSRSFNDIFDDYGENSEKDSIGNDIWNQIVQYLPITYLNDNLIGRSGRIRFIREFSSHSVQLPKHCDEMEDIFPLEKFSNIQITAQLTILIYLNHGFIGGETRFYLPQEKEENKNNYYEVIPFPGRIVIFDRNIHHSAQPIHHSSSIDKALIKLCCLYGHPKKYSSLSSLQNSTSEFSDCKIEITNLLKQFEISKDESLKREFARNICERIIHFPSHILSILFQNNQIKIEIQEERSQSLLFRLFFVLCNILQSKIRNERLLAHQTLSCLPRQQFVESGLANLLGETLLRDSMDLDEMIAFYGVKGSFYYFVGFELWGCYIHNWIQSNSEIILQACLIGLIDVCYRSHYGWKNCNYDCEGEEEEMNDVQLNEIPSNKIQNGDQIYQIWMIMEPHLPKLLTFIQFKDIDENEEKNLISELVMRFLEFQPLLEHEVEVENN